MSKACWAPYWLRAKVLMARSRGAASRFRRFLPGSNKKLALDEAIDPHWTESSAAPFRRMRVRLKDEIVTLGRPDILPHEKTGEHVSPEKWNQLIEDPNVLVIDTRNHYEVEVGTFPRAIDPGTDSFRQFPDFARQLAETSKDRPLAMFCTGGIRCEKATALMLELGFNEVYHLQGGILNYLTEMSAGENRWEGECFVFDTRVAVDRGPCRGWLRSVSRVSATPDDRGPQVGGLPRGRVLPALHQLTCRSAACSAIGLWGALVRAGPSPRQQHHASRSGISSLSSVAIMSFNSSLRFLRRRMRS